IRILFANAVRLCVSGKKSGIRELYCPTLRSRVSQINTVAEKTYSPTLAQENQVPAKFIRQCCAPACLRKIKFRENRTLFANAARPRVSGKYSSGRKELYSPTLRAHVSRVPENICIRQRCAPECKNNFIRQRCAPVCLRKRKFRKTRVSQNVVPEKMEPQEAN
ncbi:MAG: hypothetical protein NXI08_17375, partial [bacterium]|nr:hypothetical protein [bacterium]